MRRRETQRPEESRGGAAVLSLVSMMLLALTVVPATSVMGTPEQASSLVEGLDGGEYEAYKPSVIEKVQRALQEKELYEGEVDGRLDEATMQAIQSFQEQEGIQASGVPSPYTRQALFGDSPQAHAERE